MDACLTIFDISFLADAGSENVALAPGSLPTASLIYMVLLALMLDRARARDRLVEDICKEQWAWATIWVVACLLVWPVCTVRWDLQVPLFTALILTILKILVTFFMEQMEQLEKLEWECMERMEPWVGQEQLVVCIMAKVLQVLLACLASLEAPCMPELILPPMALPLTVLPVLL